MSETDIVPTQTRHLAAWFGGGLTAVIAVIAAVAGASFAVSLPRTALEAAPWGAAAGYALLRTFYGVVDGGLGAGRSFGVAFLVIAIAATAVLGRRASNDWPIGACLALGWILFPPALAVQILDTPIAPTTALITIALATLWPNVRPARGQDALGAFALAFAALQGLPGAWAALVAAVLLLLLRPRLWTLLAPALGIGLALAAIAGATVSFGLDADWTPPNRDPLLFGAVLPFGMVWAGCAVGALVSRTPSVKYRLGLRQVLVCRAAPVAYAGLILLEGRTAPSPGAAYIAAGTVFLPIALIGILPLIAWVRFAMPKTRSLLAWLAFPVIMYCAFWAVLGPISRARFPLDRAVLPLFGGP